MAPYLHAQLRNLDVSIHPVLFAAPTIGDEAFVNYFDRLFSNAKHYHIRYDLVPHCFEKDLLLKVYNANSVEECFYKKFSGPEIDAKTVAVVKGVEKMSINYKSIANGGNELDDQVLVDFIQKKDVAFIDVVKHMHDRSTYIDMVKKHS